MTTDAQPATPAPNATPAPAGTAAGEEQELLDLHVSDPQVFEHAPWRDSGRTGAERLLDLRKARAGGNEGADKADPEQAEDDGVDVSDIDLDLDAPAGDTEGEDGEEAEEEREPLKPWQPPEGQEVSELAKPHLEALDTIAKDEAQRDQIVGLYEKMVAAQTERLAAADKAAKKAAVEALGGKDAHSELINSAKTVLKSWPQELRDAVRDARTSDGRRLALMPEFVRALAGMGERQAAPQPRQDSQTSAQEELAALSALMNTDIDAYRSKPWKLTGMTGSERALQLRRQMDNPDPNPVATAAARKAEEQKLVAMSRNDPQLFAYGSYPNARSPADRLHELRTGRA